MIELCCEHLSVRCIWLYIIIMSRMSFRVDPHPIVCLNVKELLARSRRHIWSLSNSNEIRTHNHVVRKQTLNHLAKLAKWLSYVVSTLRCIWMYFIIMSRTSFRVNPHSIVLVSHESLSDLICFPSRFNWNKVNWINQAKTIKK